MGAQQRSSIWFNFLIRLESNQGLLYYISAFHYTHWGMGLVLILTCNLTSIWISIIRRRQSLDRIIVKMEIPIHGKMVFLYWDGAWWRIYVSDIWSWLSDSSLSPCSLPSLSLKQCWLIVNSLRSTQNGAHFADDIFNWFFLNEKVWISIESSLKSVPKGQINNIPALVQIMAWRRPGDKPLSEPMMVKLPTHICVTRRQWVNYTPS